MITAPILLMACGRTPEAPEDLDELTHFLYREWSNEDPQVLQVGIENLITVMSRFELDGEEANVLERSWELTPPSREDLFNVTIPEGQVPAECYGVGTARLSQWPVSDHARLQLQTDQVPAEPSAASYTRRFPEGDPGCFVEADGCEVMITENEVRRENLLMSLGFTLHKDFRWVDLADGQRAMITQTHVPHISEGDGGGGATVWQSYSMDVWMPDGDQTWRYQILWSQADVAGASDAIQIGTVKTSTDQHFEATDEAIADLFY